MNDIVTILYCKKCGWYTELNKGMRNRCQFCRQEIINHPKDLYPKFLGRGQYLEDVRLYYASGTQDEIDGFIKRNLKREK